MTDNDQVIRPEEHLVRVRFGPGETQSMPLDWAEHILTSLRENRAKQFGELLAAAAMAAR